MQNAPGKSFLKVTGILFIVFGAIAAVLGLIAMLGAGLAAQVSGVAAGLIVFSGLVTLVLSAANIFVGIFGVKNCENLEKAQSCFILGIILVGLQIVSSIINMVSGSFSILNMLIGLILPCLFLYGAMQNKKAIGQ